MEKVMNTKIMSSAVIALSLSSCDPSQNRAEEFVGSKARNEFTEPPTNKENSEDMLTGRVVGKYGYSDGTGPLDMYLMIDTNGDETAEYVGCISNANNSVTVGIAHNAEVTHQKKTIAQWKKILIDFKKIPQEKQEKTR